MPTENSRPDVKRAAASRLGAASAAILLALSGCRGKPQPWARPLRNVAFDRTPARLERGRYLAEGVLQCLNCHSERDESRPGAPPIEGKEGAGHIFYDEPPVRLVAPNLTPDKETGAGSWTDDMFARAIREGVGHDGRPLHPQMWYDAFQFLSDEDVASVVVYLRSIPAIRNRLPATRLKEGRAAFIEQGLHPLPSPVPPPDASIPAMRGRYLTNIANCQGCHTAWEAPLNPGRFGGGNLVEWAVGKHTLKKFSRNLTSDATGIPYYDDALFIEAIRTGRVRTRDLSPLMPWTVFRHMNDDDLKAMLAYLKGVPKVRHFIDETEPSGMCATCGQEHGGGKLNRPKESAAIPVDPKVLEGCEGVYLFKDAPPLSFVRAEGKLYAIGGDGKREELFTEDNRVFFTKNDPDLVEFVRDPDGRVSRLIDHAFDAEVAEKTKSP